MTEREVINKLNSLKQYYNDYDYDDGYVGFDDEDNEALDMAIKALEQTELNPSYNSVKTELEDCISRADVLELLKGIEILHNHDELRTNLIYGIMNLPPVTHKTESGEVSVLDKIRAEIEAKIVRRPWLDFEDKERDRNDAFLDVLEIIDKYKAESEE